MQLLKINSLRTTFWISVLCYPHLTVDFNSGSVFMVRGLDPSATRYFHLVSPTQRHHLVVGSKFFGFGFICCQDLIGLSYLMSFWPTARKMNLPSESSGFPPFLPQKWCLCSWSNDPWHVGDWDLARSAWHMVFLFYSHLQALQPYSIPFTYSGPMVQYIFSSDDFSGAVSQLFASSSSWWRCLIFSFGWGILKGFFQRKSPIISATTLSLIPNSYSN